MPVKTVFLSSTFRDLAQYRAAVIAAIERLDGYHCVRMENFGARDWEADSFCRAKVEECDLFIGVVGHLYGSCPPNSAPSYTEREFEAAKKKPRLIFLAPEDLAGRVVQAIHNWEKDHAHVETFRRNVSTCYRYENSARRR